MTTDLIIQQGKTFTRVIRWAVGPYIYKPITAITQAAPASVTCTAHGLVEGWRAAIVSVAGMTQINAANAPPRSDDYHKVTVTDVNTVSFNDINSARYSAYASGGYLQYLTPVSLAGYTARMSIKDAVGGTEILSLTTENFRIVLNDTAKTITLIVDAITTAALTAEYGVYDLELVAADGAVTVLLSGSITITPEVTT